METPDKRYQKIMTSKQQEELLEDIENGVVMIVDKKHYYEMEKENLAIKKKYDEMFVHTTLVAIELGKILQERSDLPG